MENIIKASTKVRLLKNKSGNWELAWTENGKTRRQSTGRKDKASAEAFRSAWIEATVVEESRAASSSLMVADIAKQYLTSATFAGGSQEWSLRPIVDPVHGLAGLVPGDITQVEADAYATSRRRRGVKDGTIRRELGAMIAALNWAAKGRLIPKIDVPEGLRLPKEGQARARFLLESDEQRLWDKALAASPSEELGKLSRMTRFVCLALATAARKEAILTLKWEQVDFGTGMIDFKDVSRAASNKRRSQIPIAKRLRHVLERAKREARDPVAGWVLDDPGAVKRSYATFMRGLGKPFSVITPHDLRRTWATLRARRGVPLWEIAQVLGDSMATVVKHYAVHQPDHLRSAVE